MDNRTVEELSQQVLAVLLDRNQSAADFQRNIQAAFDLLEQNGVPREDFPRVVSRGIFQRGKLQHRG